MTAPIALDKIALDKQIACVRRELSMRRHVYPRWVAAGKMTQDESDRQIETMQAVQATLEHVLREYESTAPGLFA